MIIESATKRRKEVMKKQLFYYLFLFILFPLYAIEVGGHLMRDTTWGPENNPYLVNTFLYVDAGATLTILPGTIIKVKSAHRNNTGYFAWNGNNEPVAKMLIVNGKIIAKGTEADPIIFEPNYEDEFARWGGIFMNVGADTSEYEHCRFLKTAACQESPGNFRFSVLNVSNGYLKVRNCYFQDNNGAIGASVKSDILVYNCQFYATETSPSPFGGTHIFAFGVDEDNPVQNYRVVVAKCFFTGNAEPWTLDGSFEYLMLNNRFENFNLGYSSNREKSESRIESRKIRNYYGNTVNNSSVSFQCAATSVPDTSYCRRNKIYNPEVNFNYSSELSSRGVGTNIVADNMGYGSVHYIQRMADSSNTYVYNNILETKSQYLVELGYGVLNVNQNQPVFFNNLFSFIGYGYYPTFSESASLSPIFFNNTIIKANTILDGYQESSKFTNNIISGFLLYSAGGTSSAYNLRYTNNCLSLPIPETCPYIDGGGNVIGEPSFLSPETGVYTLSDSSICLDSGLNMPELPAFDLMYKKRIARGLPGNSLTVDMGAYEYNSVYIGGIKGRIFDAETGLPVDCVKLTISGKLPEYSDTLGNYRSSCGEGTYTITCSRWDYEDQVLSGLVVSEGSDLVLNIYLHQTGTDNQDNVQSYSETIHRIKNYPNPFNPTTTISFELTKAERVKVSIYNIKGQKITTLRDQVFPKGQQAILWNGKDDQQKSVSSGLYFIRLETETTHYVHKTMLVK